MSAQADGNGTFKLRELFWTGIARKRLEPDEAQMERMLDFMRSVEERMQGAPRLAINPLTGDTFGEASLHTRSEFDWLTGEIEQMVMEYLAANDMYATNLAFFHQKSWPVITKTGAQVNFHSHPNAILSAVFYLQSQPGAGGEIIFHSPQEPLLSGALSNSGPPIKSTRHSYGLRPSPKMLVLFPSHLVHGVNRYRGALTRYSVSYDITITAGRNLGAGQSENMLVHPSCWREFGARTTPSQTARAGTAVAEEPTVPDADRFSSDGFLVKERLVEPATCQDLLGQVMGSWADPTRDYIHAEHRRLHAPLELTDLTRETIRSIVSAYRPVLDAFLPEPRMRYLAELSSICVFPGAAAQAIHQDQNDPQRRLVSIFVNLLDVDEDAGPLVVLPGSHAADRGRRVDASGAVVARAQQKLALPQGSSAFMDSRLFHGGSENTTANAIRPVFYVSFGEVDIDGPTYSIRPEYRQKLTLDDFS